jgi:two-component system sensor histidine kinase RegB
MSTTIDHTLRYLLLIRLVVIGGQILALAAMDLLFNVAVPWPRVSLVLVLLAAFTLLSWLRLGRSGASAGERHYLLQSLADIAALSALIFLTGGAFNPFVSLFLLPIVFAAAAMPLAYMTGIALTAIGAYTTLMLLALPERHAHAVAGRFDLHVWGMWYGFILSALCVGLFVARLSRRLRERDRELAALREEALAAERLMALGALAAGTAHELGTPLATIALAAGELQHLVKDEDARLELTRLREQLGRCREILARMSADAGALQADSGHRLALDAYLDALVAEWRQRRPAVQVRFVRNGSAPPPAIIADRVITQAIVNVLDNAADASAQRIDIDASWNAEQLQLDIRDDGTGIASELRARLGREAVTTKREGMGIGLLLSRSIVERLGGAVTLDVLAPAGTHARITLPLASLVVT